MQAKFVNEIHNFERGIDPKSAMGIGRLGALEKKHNRSLSFPPDELLIVAIRDNLPDVANYALEAGAKVIWYEKPNRWKKDEYFTAPQLSDMYVIITKVTYVTDYKNDQWIDYVFFEDVTNTIFEKGKSKKGKSRSFRTRFKHVDWDFKNMINLTLHNVNTLKKYIENNE